MWADRQKMGFRIHKFTVWASELSCHVKLNAMNDEEVETKDSWNPRPVFAANSQIYKVDPQIKLKWERDISEVDEKAFNFIWIIYEASTLQTRV